MRLGLAAIASAWIMLVANHAKAEELESIFYQAGPIAVHGDEADTLTIGAGAWDPDDQETSGAGNIEYRLGRKLFFIGPGLGLVANTDGGVFGYVGIYFDLSWGNVYLTPFGGFGGYRQGGSRNLGSVFQFRGQGDLAYRFDNGHRLGVRLAHISNANTNDPNPGAEELYLTYAIPLGPLIPPSTRGLQAQSPDTDQN